MCWLKVRHYNGCGCNMLLEYKPCEVVKKTPSRKGSCGQIQEVVERRTKTCNQGEEITKKKPCPHNRHFAGRRDERFLVKWPAHVIIPVAETPTRDQSKEPSAQPSTPVKPDKSSDQRTPVNSNNSPVQTASLNAGSNPHEIRISSSEITEHGELIEERERPQQERAEVMQLEDHTHERTNGGTSEDQESSSSSEDASKGDAPVMSDDESGRLKRPLSGTSEDRESSKRHKSVPEGEEEVVVVD